MNQRGRGFMYREEHPNPQFERKEWENLNGVWEFEIDKSCSGKERKFFERDKFDTTINVPFCPESELSGIGDTDFLNSVWYKREIDIPKTDKNIILHIGACDYLTTVYVNGNEVGVHKGGYTSFAFDITDKVNAGINTLVINAVDDVRSYMQPRGKQSAKYYSEGCDYTRVTGIWQTVWLEYVPNTHIENVKYYPDYVNGRLNIKADLAGSGVLCAEAFYKGKSVGRTEAEACAGHVDIALDLSEIHLWEPGHGRLYDLRLTFGDDEVKSYFGLRNVEMDGYKFRINGKNVFQRTVLDQGYYPDGIYTARNEDALINDIKISMDMGFNGARLHQKVFEPRYLYHCDRLGYMAWGEYGNWGIDIAKPEILGIFLREWEEALDQDFNHPSIIGWIPFNETWDFEGKKQYDDTIEMVYRTTKRIDNTRPCIDTSGHFHVVTDIFDFHDYGQDPKNFKERFDKLMTENVVLDQVEHLGRQKYNGEPVFASEYGGIRWNEDETDGWGYGTAPKTKEEFIERYKGLTDVLLDNYKIFGFCYTQLYDVEQEKNGLYTYDRLPKFDAEVIKSINERQAAIEK